VFAFREIFYGEALHWLDGFGLLDGRSSLFAFIAQAVHFGYAEQWCTVTFTNAHRKRQKTIPALLVVELEFVLTAVVVQPRIVHHRLYWFFVWKSRRKSILTMRLLKVDLCISSRATELTWTSQGGSEK
jgi:hypothetical protein